MKPIDEFLQVKKPSLESVLMLKNENPKELDLSGHVKRYLEIFKNRPDEFYNDHYESLGRVIDLANWFNDTAPFENIFELYVNLSLEEDEVLLCSCENYLEKVISPANQEFLLENWRKLKQSPDQDEFLIVEVLSLLLRAGVATEEVEQAVINILWGEDPILKGLVTQHIENLPKSQNELKRRVKFIAPMVHYGPRERFLNPYFDEWCELSEPFLKFIKGIDVDDYYKADSISRSEDDEFLVNVLGVQDDRVRRLNKRYLDTKDASVREETFKKVREVIEEHMDQNFFSKLPSSVDQWLDNPFIEPHQKEDFLDFVYSLDERLDDTDF